MNMSRARIKSIVVLNLCVYKCQAGDLPALQILSTSRCPILKSLESCLIMDISFRPRFFRRFYDRAIEKLRVLQEIDLFLRRVSRNCPKRAPRLSISQTNLHENRDENFDDSPDSHGSNSPRLNWGA